MFKNGKASPELDLEGPWLRNHNPGGGHTQPSRLPGLFPYRSGLIDPLSLFLPLSEILLTSLAE